MKPQAHSYLQKIENYKPGKAKINDSASKVIKLSSNENALGASPKAIKAYKSHEQELFRYANGSCEDLRKALAAKHQINENNIVCGAGSDEIISFITQAFAGINDEIIYSEHGFLMYPISANRVGAIARVAKEKNLKTDISEIIKLINKKTKIIFIANPNNPTGSYLNAKEIDALINAVPKNIIIVLDHAYEEFVNVENYPNAVDLVKKNCNLIMTRTFSKIYGLASLRIGWCYASNEITDILNKIRGPFNVSGSAQISAIEALKDDKFLKKSKNHNKKWLKIINKELADFKNIKLYPTQGNFILADFFSENKAIKMNDILLKNGIIVREMSSYHLPNCLRITVGNKDENIKLLSVIKNNLMKLDV